MDWLVIFNFICMIVCWRWASEAFDNGHKGAGWFNVFASALNAAAVASHFV